MNHDRREMQRKLRVLEHADRSGSLEKKLPENLSLKA